ncbi:hypothetical protein Trydic_g21464 [Trypoxylus dichotomus]
MIKKVLSEDLAAMRRYFRRWELQPRGAKTETTCFHVNNKMANRKIEELCGTIWDSSAATLRFSALELVYSAAEHCAPV